MNNPNHVQKYKGVTLSNNFSYQYQMDIIDRVNPSLLSPLEDMPRTTKKANMMNYQTLAAVSVPSTMTVKEKTQADARLEYFLERACSIRYDHAHELEKKFGLCQTRPTSIKELVEWIKEGNFSIMEGYDEDDELHCPEDYLRWTKKKADRKGFQKAIEKLDTEHQTVKDLLWAETDANKYAEIVAKFEKKTFN